MFEYLRNFLDSNIISYREAGHRCGRTGTAVSSWCKGQHIQDKQVQKCISLITGDSIERVIDEVNAHLVKIGKLKAGQSQTVPLKDICDKFIAQLDTAVDGKGVPLDAETVRLAKGVVKSFRGL